MSSSKNFEFRKDPRSGQRSSRFRLGSEAVPIGAPVVLSATADHLTDELGLLEVELATGAQAPEKAVCGIAVFEHIDPDEAVYGDVSVCPAGRPVQVTYGDAVKVAFRNTADRTMVAGLGATPTLEVGDLLSPGTGTDEDGYWAANSTASNGWMVVTHVDASVGLVEAEFIF